MPVFDVPPGLSPVSSFLDLIDQGVVYTDPRTSAALRQIRAQPVWHSQLEFQALCVTKWRALAGLLANLKGPLNILRLWDYSDPGDLFVTGGRHWDDGMGFSDGTLWREEALRLTAIAHKGDESIQVRSSVPGGVDIPLGYKIGLPDDRLYIVTAETHVGADADAVLPIRPPISRQEAGDTPVVTYRPTSRFYRIGSDPITRDVAKFGSISLNFAQEPRP